MICKILQTYSFSQLLKHIFWNTVAVLKTLWAITLPFYSEQYSSSFDLQKAVSHSKHLIHISKVNNFICTSLHRCHQNNIFYYHFLNQDSQMSKELCQYDRTHWNSVSLLNFSLRSTDSNQIIKSIILTTNWINL